MAKKMGENPNFKYPYTFLFDKKNNNDDKNDLDGESKYYFDVKNIAAAYYNMPANSYVCTFFLDCFLSIQFLVFLLYYFKELVRLSRSVRTHIY